MNPIMGCLLMAPLLLLLVVLWRTSWSSADCLGGLDAALLQHATGLVGAALEGLLGAGLQGLPLLGIVGAAFIKNLLVLWIGPLPRGRPSIWHALDPKC